MSNIVKWALNIATMVSSISMILMVIINSIPILIILVVVGLITPNDTVGSTLLIFGGLGLFFNWFIKPTIEKGKTKQGKESIEGLGFQFIRDLENLRHRSEENVTESLKRLQEMQERNNKNKRRMEERSREVNESQANIPDGVGEVINMDC